MNKSLIISIVFLLTQGKLLGQNCDCKILTTSYDSVFEQTMSLPKVFDYVNDTLLVIKYGTALTQLKFTFEDFEKDKRPLKNDSLIIRNGELLQNIGGTQKVVYSPKYFSDKKATYLYKFVDKSKDGYFEVIKFKYEPIRKEKVKGKTYYKYISKGFSYIISSKGNNADSVKQNMLSISDEKFKTNSEDDLYFYFVPGKGFLIDFCDKDLPLHVYFNQYKDTPCCDKIIKRKFKTWK